MNGPTVLIFNLQFGLDSNFLDDLERRLNIAEEKYREADLEAKLKQLEEAKQRQVK